MDLKQFTYLIVSILLFSCSSIKQENNKTNGDFSEKEAIELANHLKTSSDSSNKHIIEENMIGTKLTYSDSIWKLVTPDLTNCSSSNNSMNIDNKIWSYCEHNNELKLYQVQYIQNNIRITEKYLTRNNQLIYIVESEKRKADMSDDEATYWNCEYIIKDDQVVDYMSLGMGKTESDLFDIQDIITLWHSRQVNFSKLKK